MKFEEAVGFFLHLSFQFLLPILCSAIYDGIHHTCELSRKVSDVLVSLLLNSVFVCLQRYADYVLQTIFSYVAVFTGIILWLFYST